MAIIVSAEDRARLVAINRYNAEHNTVPKPCVWTADPDDIIATDRYGHQALTSIPDV